MPLTDDLQRIMGFDQGPDNNAEVNIKIKPLGSVSGGTATAATSPLARVGGPPPGGPVGAYGLRAGGPPPGGAIEPLASRIGGPPPGGPLDIVADRMGGPPPGGPIEPLGEPRVGGPPPGGAESAAGLSPGAGITGAEGAGSLGGAAPPPGGLPSFFGPSGSVVPQDQWRSYTNPQLVTHPLGSQTDSMYEAAVAQLQNQTNQQYLDTLKEIGWMGENNQFMPGTLETEAVRQRADITRQRELALQDVINKAVGRNAVFSGRRATLQSQAQAPYDAAMANLESSLSRELGNRYELLGRITGNFETSRNMLLAEAADRIAQQQRQLAATPGQPGWSPEGPPAGTEGPGYTPPGNPLYEALMAGIPSGPQPGFGDFGGVTEDDWLRAIQQQGNMKGMVPY